MRNTWFKRFGWFYVPVSLPGAIIVPGALAFCAPAFPAIDRRAHSVSDTVYGVFPYVAGGFLLVDWIVGRIGDRSVAKKHQPGE